MSQRNPRVWERGKSGGEREQTPTEEKEKMALKLLGYASCKESEKIASSSSKGQVASDYNQSHKDVKEWVEEEKKRAGREYQAGVPIGKRCPA